MLLTWRYMARKKSPGELRTQLIRVDKIDHAFLKIISLNLGISIAEVVHRCVSGQLIPAKTEIQHPLPTFQLVRPAIVSDVNNDITFVKKPKILEV
jgi:hypothetical protein